MDIDTIFNTWHIVDFLFISCMYRFSSSNKMIVKPDSGHTEAGVLLSIWLAIGRTHWVFSNHCRGFPVALVVRNLPVSAGDTRDMGSITGSGRHPRGKNGNPLQYACLENSMDRAAWQAPVCGVTESDATTPINVNLDHQNELFRTADMWNGRSLVQSTLLVFCNFRFYYPFFNEET